MPGYLITLYKRDKRICTASKTGWQKWAKFALLPAGVEEVGDHLRPMYQKIGPLYLSNVFEAVFVSPRFECPGHPELQYELHLFTPILPSTIEAPRKSPQHKSTVRGQYLDEQWINMGFPKQIGKK
jgi:hypothetical protein